LKLEKNVSYLQNQAINKSSLSNLWRVVKQANEPLDDDAEVRDVPEKSGLGPIR
jgi:hypothetical protein